MTLEDGDFAFIAALVRDRAAIALRPEKRYLVEHRIAPVAQQRGTDIRGLVAQLRGTPFGDLHRDVIEAMTTNETSWFRDSRPFEALRTEVLPGLIRANATERALTVWSAACSSGQEPYSIALMIKEHFPQLASWNVRIVATDLSSAMLGQAAAGRYNQLEINRGLPAKVMVKYFKRVGRQFELVPEIRQMVEFRTLNLADPTWPFVPRCDVVLLRNVLIYFDDDVKRRILTKAAATMKPGGWLVLGGAETTLGLSETFERASLGGATMYRRQGDGGGGTAGAPARPVTNAPTARPAPRPGMPLAPATAQAGSGVGRPPATARPDTPGRPLPRSGANAGQPGGSPMRAVRGRR